MITMGMGRLGFKMLFATNQVAFDQPRFEVRIKKEGKETTYKQLKGRMG